jgi:hypothetical protein
MTQADMVTVVMAFESFTRLVYAQTVSLWFVYESEG